MSKVKYYYDSENLAYRKIKTRKRRKLGVIILFLLASALFGFLSFILLLNTPYFETPKDRLQAREIENLRLNYAVESMSKTQLKSGISKSFLKIEIIICIAFILTNRLFLIPFGKQDYQESIGIKH